MKVRDILEELSIESLNRLLDERGLARGRGMQVKLETLARSYKGDFVQLFEDCTKAELIQILRGTWQNAEGPDFELVGLNSASVDELRTTASELIVAEWSPEDNDEKIPGTDIRARILHEDADENEGGDKIRRSSREQTASAGSEQAMERDIRMPDPRDVFVVHGRDMKRVAFFFDLLRRMGLNPMEFDEAIARTGSAAPYIGDVVKTALDEAKAVVVLFTGDDMAHLRHDLAQPHEDSERTPKPQPRPNVILEAGMALALDRKRTILIEVPPLRGISDLQGVHVIRFGSGDPAERNKLAARLATAGCTVRTTGSDWLTLPFPH
jgi:predicted nucleotide-binding protein